LAEIFPSGASFRVDACDAASVVMPLSFVSEADRRFFVGGDFVGVVDVEAPGSYSACATDFGMGEHPSHRL